MVDEPATRSAVRPGPTAIRMAMALVVGLLALAWGMSVRLAAPADGTAVFTGSQWWKSDGVVVSMAVGTDNPLRAGDLVTAVDGQPLTAGITGREPQVGDTVVYRVVRDGTIVDVPVTLRAYPLAAFVARLAYTLPYVALMLLVPAFVFACRPRDPAAVTLLAIGALHFGGFAGYPLGTQVIDVAGGRLWPGVVAEVSNGLLWAALLHFTVSLPQPWPLLRRRPWLILVVYALPFLAYGAVLAARLPGAAGLRRTWLLTSVSVPAATIFPVLVAAAMVASYAITRDRFARQRMRWVSYALGFMAASYLVLGRIPELLGRPPIIGWDALGIVFLPFPIALGAAVLRYRLFDIRIILRRSLVYGLVTAGLMIAYLTVVALAGAVSGAGAGAGVVPVLVAAVVALAFSPTRTAMRRVVSRLVYGEREDPYEVLRQLGQRLESADSTEAVLSQLVQTLVRTLRLSYAAIDVPGLDLPSSRLGTPGDSAHVIALVHRGEHIGQLVLDPGPNREPFGRDDQRLVDGLAQQVSVTAHSLLLAVNLQRSLERTVILLEEERRRVRRDIHDGLGPTLASAVMRLDLGRSLLHNQPATADRILETVGEAQQQALDDIRRLIDGLRPTILDHLGLARALEEQVERLRGPAHTTLSCSDDLEPLPAAVEVAVYRIVSEALTNVVRHAQASTCDIRVWRDAEVHVEVRDNGRGLPTTFRPGVGLTSIRERCGELGGAATFVGTPGGGTTIRCHLPVATIAGGGLAPRVTATPDRPEPDPVTSVAMARDGGAGSW